MVSGATIALFLTSCGPQPPAATSDRSRDPGHAVILTARPVQRVPLPAGALLRDGGDPASLPPNATEYVVRTDDGATLAFVQASESALVPGQSVTIAGQRLKAR
jgi:hypothetical protein